MYNFGNRSLSKLETCHSDLQLIMQTAIKRSCIDFGISEGYRSLERQKRLYDDGKSKIDGVSRKGKHNSNPSMACDIFAYHPNIHTRKKIAYNVPTLSFIAGIVVSVSKELKEKGLITHSIRWGGNWDNDGIILLDQNFDDLPHFELI